MIRFELNKIPGATRLFSDYVGRDTKAIDLFERDPRDLASARVQAEAISQREYERERLAEILEKQNSRWGCEEAATANCRRLRRPNCLAVVTGQQVGLFGGPLYTAVKALHAVGLAEYYEQQLGQPVVPIFWMELEDHDLDEVSRIVVKDEEHQLHHLQLNPSGVNQPSRKPVREIKLGEDVERIRKDLDGIWPRTEHTRALNRLLKESCSPDRTFSEAFAVFMSRLLSRFGLILADPSHPELKRRAAAVFSAEIDGPLTGMEDYVLHLKAIREAGYHVQVETRGENLQLFLTMDGEKQRLASARSGFRLVGAETRLSRDELQKILEGEPDKLVPAVLLRPLVQDTLFPTLAYIGGPAEIAYWAQLKPLYRSVGIPMPLVVPRAGATVTGSASRRFIQKFGIDVAGGELFQEKESLVGHVLSEHLPSHSKQIFRSAREEIQGTLERLQSELQAENEGFTRATEAVQQKVGYHLERLENKYGRAMERKHEDVVRQIERLSNTLYPGGMMQERAFPQAQFVNLYGTTVYDLIAEAINPTDPDHCFVEV
jgi:bacillithiol biosynthesis cysteine-adding enzyme BshC